MSYSGSVLLLLFCHSLLHFIHGTVALEAAGVAEGATNAIPQCEVLTVIVVIIHLKTLKYQILGSESFTRCMGANASAIRDSTSARQLRKIGKSLHLHHL